MITPRCILDCAEGRQGSTASRGFGDESGAGAVEFALLVPVILGILVATSDFGMALYARFKLNGAISAASNYTLLNSASVASSGGSTLAQNLATLIYNDSGSSNTTVQVVVNNGPAASVSGGTVSTSGTAANANSCYCPTYGAGAVTWGAAMSCGTACSGAGVAGKFVWLSASAQYNSVMGSASPASGAYGASAMVETQ